MFSSLRHLLARWFGTAPQDNAAPEANEAQHPSPEEVSEPSALQEAAVHNQPAPYDKNLLECARTQWQFGDWDSLAELDQDTLQYHPDRAKLALLVAAGRLQKQRTDEARQYIRLAQEWGIGKKLISQILIAGVHNSLGRANMLANHQSQGLAHFRKAIDIGTPDSNSKLLSQARTNSQLNQLGIPISEQYLKANDRVIYFNPLLIDKSMELNFQELKQQQNILSEKISNQSTNLLKIQKQLEITVKQEILNATQQLEAFLNIQNFFTYGEHQPIMHGWPVSPDFALYIIKLLEKNDYDLIIEFGSGTSTVLIAKALDRLNKKRLNPNVVQVAFEHLEKYYKKTISDLEAAGMRKSAEVILAPLQPYKAHDGNTYYFYDFAKKITDLSTSKIAKNSKILVLVDGPPKSTGKHARYPALPSVLTYFNNHQVDFLLDDYFRTDEKEVSELWIEFCKTSGFNATTETIKMEKDAFFLSVHPK